jgi:hypothetical protein
LKYFNHATIYKFEWDNKSICERKFEDNGKYTLRCYDTLHLLCYITYGHWDVIEWGKSLSIVYDSAFNYDNRVRNRRNLPLPIDLYVREINDNSIEFFQEADENIPSSWEIWQKVL